MLFTSVTQFAVLVLLVIIGWLFGFASHPGGKRWKQAYREQVSGRASDRDQMRSKLNEQDARIAALEKENAELAARLTETRGPIKSELPVTTASGALSAAGAVAASAARPAYSEGPYAPVPPMSPAPAIESGERDRFDRNAGDDLTQLRGVDAELAARLKAEGVDRFGELAELDDQEEMALERRLDLPAGYIMREQLREQARLLADGQSGEHAQRFDR